MVGWCLTFWYILSPGPSAGLGLSDLLEAHLTGAGAMLGFALLRAWLSRGDAPVPVPLAFVTKDKALPHACLRAVVLVLDLGVGHVLLDSDPSMIAAAMLNVIGLCAARTCAAVWERMLFATAGLCLGVWLRLTHTDVLAGLLVVAGASFLAIAFIRQSFAPTVFSFARITS